MLDGLVESAVASGRPRERKVEGIAIAQVVDNVDATNKARVQIRLPWLPDFEPWARVATLNAGSGSGTYLIPQVGDEVVVAFNQGDVREPYILGSVWNGQDGPPSSAGADARSKRIIRTPIGHEVAFDENEQTITITTNTKQSVTLSRDKIVVATANSTSTATLEASGKLTLEAQVSIEIKAPTVSIKGTTVDVTADATATLKGSGMCVVKGGVVAIN